MIQDSVNKVIYSGNGEATEFFYPFEITKNTDVKVMTVSPDGGETVLTNDYYVDVEKSIVYYPGWADGEEPDNADDFLPLADGWRLIVYREVDYTQEVSMYDRYPFNVLEGMIDKNTILAQQLKDGVNRSMRLSISVDNTDVDMTIPHGKGTSFRWSDDGTRLEVTDDPAVVRKVVENLAGTIQIQSDAAIASAKTASEAAAGAKASETAAQKSEMNAETYMNTTKEYMDSTKAYMDTTEGYMDSAASSATSAASSETAAYKSSLSASTSATTATSAAQSASASSTKANTAATTAVQKAASAEESAEAAAQSAKKAQDTADSIASGQVQTDWDETDSTSKAYLKNAPRFITVSERVRGDDEPTYGITDETFVLSDGTVADEASVLSLDVDGTLYDVGDQYSVITNE